MNPLDALREEMRRIEPPVHAMPDPVAIWNRARVDTIVDESRRVVAVNRAMGIVQLLAADAIAATLVWPMTNGNLALTVIAAATMHACATFVAAARVIT